jgi:hypothetical protein
VQLRTLCRRSCGGPRLCEVGLEPGGHSLGHQSGLRVVCARIPRAGRSAPMSATSRPTIVTRASALAAPADARPRVLSGAERARARLGLHRRPRPRPDRGPDPRPPSPPTLTRDRRVRGPRPRAAEDLKRLTTKVTNY